MATLASASAYVLCQHLHAMFKLLFIGASYGELAEGKGHIACVASDFDENSAVITKRSSNLGLQIDILNAFGQAEDRFSTYKTSYLGMR
jgi:hypothetical protein